MTEPRKRAEREALRWAARRLSGDMTERESLAFRRWLDRRQDNRDAFAELCRLDPLLDAAAGALVTRESEAELDALSSLSGRRAARAPMRGLAARPGWRTWTAGGASAAAAIAASVFLVAAPVTTQTSFAAAVGAQENFVLRDGTSVHLNTASRVDIAYSRRERLARLEDGEALFQVARAPERPFIVETGAAVITVTGTVFNVQTGAAGTDVSVLEGSVSVAPRAGGAALRLGAGDALRIGADGEAGPVAAFDPAQRLAWRTGKARYRDMPLSEVIADLNRYFDPPIMLGDLALGALPVTGEFDIRERDTAVAALSVAFGLETENRNGAVVLRRRAVPH